LGASSASHAAQSFISSLQKGCDGKLSTYLAAKACALRCPHAYTLAAAARAWIDRVLALTLHTSSLGGVVGWSAVIDATGGRLLSPADERHS
jgi:hypothetical protein